MKIIRKTEHVFHNETVYECLFNDDIYKFVVRNDCDVLLGLHDIPVYILNGDDWELVDIVPGVDIYDGMSSFMELHCFEV